LPSAAWKEWEQAPAGLLETIIAYRAYARAKGVYDRRGQSRPTVPLLDVVTAIDFDLVAEALKDRP
jgi:hypothetical protein